MKLKQIGFLLLLMTSLFSFVCDDQLCSALLSPNTVNESKRDSDLSLQMKRWLQTLEHSYIEQERFIRPEELPTPNTPLSEQIKQLGISTD